MAGESDNLSSANELIQRDLEQHALRAAFPDCSETFLQSISHQLSRRIVPKGDVLIQMDEAGTCAYLLLSGSLQVYGRGQGHQLVPICTLDTPGRLLGEQALLPGHRHRNATVVALEQSLIVELPPQVFEQLLNADPNAQARLQSQSLDELRERLQRLGIGLDATLVDPAISSSIQLAAGDVLLAAGEVPERAYSVVAGRLSLRKAAGGEPVLMLGPGSLVGVQELLQQQPLRLTAVADVAVELLPITRQRLEQLPDSQDLSARLQALIALPGLGRVYRSCYVRDGEQAVISDYDDVPGGAVRVLHRPSRRRVEATRLLSDGKPGESWSTPDGNNQLLIEPGSGHLLGLAMAQDWPQLSDLMGLFLRDIPLQDWQLQGFRANGQLLLEAAEARVKSGSQMICACTGTSGTAMEAAVNQCDSLEEVQELTAAGTVCGGCINRLRMLLHQSPDTRLCRVQLEALTERAVKLTLQPLESQPLPAWVAGEHLLVEGLIDGVWVGRNYTITGGDSRHYELGIKREPGGIFSNWLAESGPNNLVRVSAPQGCLLPKAKDERPLIYLVAGIGVTPAIAGVRQLRHERSITVVYSFRGEPEAPYLDELRQFANATEITLYEHDSSQRGRLDFHQAHSVLITTSEQQACEVVVCGPEAFNIGWKNLFSPLEHIELRLESFRSDDINPSHDLEPGSWRRENDALVRQQADMGANGETCPRPIQVGETCPMDEARSFLDSFRREVAPGLQLETRLQHVEQDLLQNGQWQLRYEELQFGARLAWRQAERCVGRLYWQSLELFDRRELSSAEDIADALFEHLRFAFNGGDLQPAISVFNPGDAKRAAPRIWNSQLLRYAGFRNSNGRQVGDPAQNAITARIMELGWRPKGMEFELLPLVIQTAEEGPRLFELPSDCRQDVSIRHPNHPWLEDLQLRWYAVPAVSDMALEIGGNRFPLAPFNGWYLDTEIAARNFSDRNRFNLLPRLAEGLGLDVQDDRTLWRDHAQLVLAEAVLYSFDQAGVRISDHHGIGHEFLEFCRSEHRQGREIQAEWSWVVPPMSGSLNVLYQESFDNKAFKPAYVAQAPIWDSASESFNAQQASSRCPFSS